MKTSEQTDSLSIKDAYTLYEEGKKRRYELLFTVNGGAFAIAQLLSNAENKEQVLGNLTLAHLAIGMGMFTILMVWDIFAFGQKMRDRHLREVFGPEGKAILILLGLLIVAGWLLVASGSQITTPQQIVALLFPIGFLAALRWFSRPSSSR